MAHIRHITVSKAAVSDKQIDPIGSVFLQLWLFVFSWIIFGAFGSKNGQ